MLALSFGVKVCETHYIAREQITWHALICSFCIFSHPFLVFLLPQTLHLLLISLHHLQNAFLSIVTDLQKDASGPDMKTKVTITKHEIDYPVRLSIPVNFFHGSSSFLSLGTLFLPLFGILFFVRLFFFFCGTGKLFSLFFVFTLFLFFPRLGFGLSGTGMGSSSAAAHSGESYSL